ncbi:AaceriAGR326Cp [[Ashbya] aceris (nom. inval.)]|nr:AaceriAGR326Cp [[Ashbya] aceris (nom. inval.)]
MSGMKSPEKAQLHHLIVQHAVDSIMLIWTMSFLCFYLESLPMPEQVDAVSQTDRDQLVEWLEAAKKQLHDRLADSQCVDCRSVIDRSMLQGLSRIKDKMQAQLHAAKETRLINQLSNCYNGFVHTLQFLRKLPVGNGQVSYEIPAHQWKVLLHEQELMNSNWKVQLKRFGIMSAKLVAPQDGTTKDFLSQFCTQALTKVPRD